MTEKETAADHTAILEVLMLSKDATAIYQGRELKIIFANDAMLGFWGKGRDIIGMSFNEALPELSGQPFEDILKEVWDTGKTYTAQNTAADLATPEGIKTFYFDFTYRAILDTNGDSQWILHSTTEVSDRMRLEHLEREAAEILLESQNRIEQLVMTSPIGMTILSGTDLVIQVPNDHILEIWGRTREQVLGKGLLDVFPELIGQPFPAMLASVLETGNPVHNREIAVTVGDIDGGRRDIFVDFGYQPLFSPDGTVDSVMVTVKDITEVVQTRQKLERSESLLQDTNEELEAANEEYQATNEELAALNEEFAATNEELTATNEEVNLLSQELRDANELLNEHNKELSAATRKLFSLFEDAPVAIGLLRGRELVIEYANPEILRLWGKDSDILEKRLDIAIPELKDQAFLDLLDSVYTSGIPYIGMGQKAILMHHGKKTEVYFNFTYKPIMDELGNPEAIMIVASEVTDQILAKHQIEEAYQQLNFALDVGNVGSYEIDARNGELKYNHNFAKDFGIENNGGFNLDDLLEIVVADYRPRLEADIRDAMQHGSTLSGEFRIRWADGSSHWISASGKTIFDGSGRPIKMVGMTENITEQKALDQRKDDFLSVASHELKTPVTTLKANMQLLSRIKSQLEHPMAERIIDSSMRSMDKLNIMIGNLLNINRFNEGQITLEKTHFSIKSLLGDCCGSVRIEGKHELIVTGDDVVVNADESRIEQVVTNLVNNAAKYAPDSRDILLHIERMDGIVKVSVKDNGPGISDEQLPHLFERYWRADHSGKHYSGLGLGLFICAEIIQRHGGKIGADSEVGRGTTFWFTLPAVI